LLAHGSPVLWQFEKIVRRAMEGIAGSPSG
jgi:hypothetical protein